MTRFERENWIVNIENAASFISSEVGEEAVESTLYRFGAGSIDDITDTDLSEVFSELYAVAVDLRSG